MTPRIAAALGLVVSSLVPLAAHADEKAACVDAYGRAQSLRDANQLLGARDQLRVCARTVCTKFIAKDCAAWLVDVESRISSVVLTAKDASGADIGTATVSVDGKVIAQQLDGHAIEVDAGRHTFAFTLPDGSKVEQAYTVREGQKAQQVAVTMPAPRPPSGAGPEAPAPLWGGDTPPATKGSHWSGRKTLAVVTAGVGVAGLGVGAAFGLSAIASFKSQRDNCHSSAPGDCVDPAQAQKAHEAAATASTISTVGFIAGGALAAAGAVLFLTTPRNSGEPEGKTPTGLQVLPSVSPAGAGMWLRGRF